MAFSMGSRPYSTDSAGTMLRRQREALGLDIADVAAALRIKPAYLAALEDGRPEALPGAVYAIGFMRAYADYLGLDSGEMLRLFKQQSSLLAAKPDLAFPIQFGERSISGGGMLLVALILAVCGRAMALGRNVWPKYHSNCCRTGSRFELHEPSHRRRMRSWLLNPRLYRRKDQDTPAPFRPGRVRAGAPLLPVRRWPRCLTRRQTRRARSSFGLPPTVGFKSATLASRCF
jgi:transcriptional regulator with XRE-family HTH domain